MLLVRIALVVEVVEQARQPPGLLVGSALAGAGPHGGLDGIHMAPQPLGGGIIAHQLQRLLTGE